MTLRDLTALKHILKQPAFVRTEDIYDTLEHSC